MQDDGCSLLVFCLYFQCISGREADEPPFHSYVKAGIGILKNEADSIIMKIGS